jgi:hypothetical protein
MKFFLISLFFMPLVPAHAAIIVNSFDEIQQYIDQGRREEFHVIDQSLLKSIQFTDEGNIEVIWGPRQVATLASSSDMNNVTTTGQLKEISCLPFSYLSGCDLSLDFLVEHYRLAWKEHPSPEKINQMVKLQLNETEKSLGQTDPKDPIRSEFFWTYENRFDLIPAVKPDNPLVDQMQAPRMQCGDNRWARELSSQFGETNQSFPISEWITEGMSDNPETGINENVTLASVFNVEMNLDEDVVVISEIGFLSTTVFGSPSLFFGDIVGWSLKKEERSCDLAFTFDSTPVQAAFNESQQNVQVDQLEMATGLTRPMIDNIGRVNTFSFFSLLSTLESDHPIYLNAMMGLLSLDSTQIEEFQKNNDDGTQEPVYVSVNRYSVREEQE